LLETKPTFEIWHLKTKTNQIYRTIGTTGAVA